MTRIHYQPNKPAQFSLHKRASSCSKVPRAVETAHGVLEYIDLRDDYIRQRERIIWQLREPLTSASLSGEQTTIITQFSSSFARNSYEEALSLIIAVLQASSRLDFSL